MQYSSKQISDSRKEALSKIIEILDKGNPDELFQENNGDYYSDSRFLLVWKSNWNGMPSECRIDKCDGLYKSMSGYSAIYANVGLFHEKQIKGYITIERAFIDVGLKLCSKKQKTDFFNKYAKPYNERLSKLISPTTQNK